MTGTEEQGKAGPAAAPGANLASPVRAPSFLAKHRLSRQPPCAVVCALPSFLESEDLEGFHRYFFFLLCHRSYWWQESAQGPTVWA